MLIDIFLLHVKKYQTCESVNFSFKFVFVRCVCSLCMFVAMTVKNEFTEVSLY
jgi:hypothetical protein